MKQAPGKIVAMTKKQEILTDPKSTTKSSPFRIGIVILATLIANGLSLVHAGEFKLSVSGEKLLLNGSPFKVIGLRTSNALISDATTQQLIDHLDVFKGYGVNTVSVYVMGSRFGDVKGYLPDASLNPIYMERLSRIIEACDRRGMVVLVGCIYWGDSEARRDLKDWTQADANRAVANTVAWLDQKGYRNTFVDPDNEGMAKADRGWDIGEMISAAKALGTAIPIAYNARQDPPANADILAHFSPRVPGRPWIETEGSPNNAPGGYWGRFSKQGRFRNYIRIGRYTSDMKERQLELTFKAIEEHSGYIIGSTWLQCVAGEGVGGPFMTPGGTADNPAVDDMVTQVQEGAGIRWWLEAVREKYGPWKPPVPGESNR